MTNSITILFIVSVVAITIIIVTGFLVYLSKVVMNKDIELENSIDIKIIDGSVKSTLTFGCKTVLNQPIAQPDTPKNERKKRMIKRSAPFYHHTKTHN